MQKRNVSLSVQRCVQAWWRFVSSRRVGTQKIHNFGFITMERLHLTHWLSWVAGHRKVEDGSAMSTLPHLSLKAVKATTCLNTSPRGHFLPAGIVQTASSLQCIWNFEAYVNCRSYLGAPMKIFSWTRKNMFIPAWIFVESFFDNVCLPMQFWLTQIASTKYFIFEMVRMF